MTVFKFWESNQTFCPFSNGVNVSFLLPAMHVLANSWAARASSQFFIKLFIFSSIDGYFVCLKAKGIATGVVPSISSKGVWVQSACHWLLCVNSIVKSIFDHLLVQISIPSGVELWDTWQGNVGHSLSLRRMETLSGRSRAPSGDLDGPQKLGILHVCQKAKLETGQMVAATSKIWLPIAPQTWKVHGQIQCTKSEIWPWDWHRRQPKSHPTHPGLVCHKGFRRIAGGRRREGHFEGNLMWNGGRRSGGGSGESRQGTQKVSGQIY